MKYTHINKIKEMQDWLKPKSFLVNVIEGEESVELIFTENPMLSSSEKRVYKIIYSIEEGKWKRSEPIYGKIIPATEESYEF